MQFLMEELGHSGTLQHLEKTELCSCYLNMNSLEYIAKEMAV